MTRFSKNQIIQKEINLSLRIQRIANVSKAIIERKAKKVSTGEMREEEMGKCRSSDKRFGFGQSNNEMQ